jgi:formate/nitrite transporter FocA (FNT family)
MMKHYLDTFLYGIMGGICIALGGTAYLCAPNSILGATLFAIGLFTICTMGFNLYTGKVAYVFNNGLKYLLDVALIWLSNFCGAALVAALLAQTRLAGTLYAKAAPICALKLADGAWSLFILGAFCNLMIFIAVDSFKNNEHPVGKYLGLLFGVVTFIFCGYEHSIADMFYFTAGDAWSLTSLGKLLVITIGNAAGGVLIPLVRLLHERFS